MHQDTAIILVEFVVLLFAFCVHEAAHAWMASRLGDQTARMLGRVTLNPAKHIDPLGSILIPLVSAFYHAPLIGWARPTPITPRNFKNYKRDDILVTIAGPISNLLMASVCLIGLIALKHLGGDGALQNAFGLLFGDPEATVGGNGALFPLALILFAGVTVNLSLFAFNLIPIPPLDGSRVLVHFLPVRMQEMYNRIGMFSLLILMLAGGRMMGIVYTPLLVGFIHMLNAL